MTSKELIKEYFEGGNAQNVKSEEGLRRILEAIKEMGDKLDKEIEKRGERNNFRPNSPDPRNSNK